MSHIHYSIVIPVYCNEGCLNPLMQSLTTDVFQANPNHNGEIIFVDDGSEDGSLEELMRIRIQSPSNITVIKLTRNFGQGGALLAGYEHARGDCVITISADGQEPPSLINEMLHGFFDEHYETVICARAGRDESLYRRVTSRLYYSSMRRLNFKNMPRGGFDVWLMSRRALEVFLRNADANLSFQGQTLWMGFRTKYLSYRRRARLAGVSRFTFTKKLTGFLDGIIAHSSAPLRAMWITGFIVAMLGFAYAGFIVVDSLLLGHLMTTWAPLMIVLLVVGGLQMTMLGIIGEYLWRALVQVRNRDMYLIDAIFGPEEPLRDQAEFSKE